MKPWVQVSSFRGANTLFQGQQINGQRQRRETLKRETEERSPKEITEERSKERPETQIKEDPRTRADETGPLRDATSEGQSTL
jgi:hypothetical protein